MIYKFETFELDDARFALIRDGSPIVVEPKALRVLLFLVRNPNRLIRKQELLDTIWLDTAVSENALTRSITLLRKALEDSSKSPRFIETVPTAGYRFLAAVQEVDDMPADSAVLEAAPAPAAPASVSPTAQINRRNRFVLALACVALLIAVVGWRMKAASRKTGAIHSIAVLPLDNLSGDSSQDYFADGMTDELITELAGIPDLRVISRTSAMTEKGSHKTLRQIAEDLDVDAIVEGSVLKSGSSVRITAQLIDARDDKHLWAQSFEGQSADIVSLQDTVAREIAQHAKVALVPALNHGATTRTVNLAAYDALLRGRYFYAKQDLGRSAEYFQQAIAADPKYAPAYAGLADDLEAETTFGLVPINEGMPKALAAAQHAIALDPQNGEAYEALGSIETIYQWNWQAAESDLNRSITLSPNFPVAEMKYATYLDAVGSIDEAAKHMRRALSLDPMSFYMTRRLGATLYLARDYDGALQQLLRAAEMEPEKQSSVDPYLIVVYEKKGMQDQSVDADLQLLRSARPTLDTARLSSVYKHQGWKAYWRARIEGLEPYPDQVCAAYDVGLSYLRIGDLDRAFSSFNLAVDQRCFQVVLFRTDPALDPIREDARYNNLLQRVHLAVR